MSTVACHEDAPKRQIRFLFTAEFWRSEAQPEHSSGRVARIVAMRLGDTPDTLRYIIDIESRFYCDEDTEEAKVEELQREGSHLLESMSYLVT